MPVIKSIVIGSCAVTPTDPNPVSGTRLVQEIEDADGDGIVFFTANNGALPTDLENKVDVYLNGNLLTYIHQYTITPFATPTSSQITVLNSFPGAFVKVTAYYD